MLISGSNQHACMTSHLIRRLDDALSDCIWAKKHMRDNTVIDYRQLGLPHKLFSWQVCLCLSVCLSVSLHVFFVDYFFSSRLMYRSSFFPKYTLCV